MEPQKIVCTDDCSEETLIKFVSKIFKEKWNTSFDYQTIEPIHFETNDLPIKIMADEKFMAYCLYISELIDKMLDFDFQSIKPEWIRKEIMSWDQKGGLCIYLAVLHYCLIYQTGILDESRLKFIQGFYNHPTTEQISMLFFGDKSNQSGLHAFLAIDNCVVDFAIKQEACVFDFGDHQFILGQIPSMMKLGGWQEDLSIVKKYAREIAKSSDMTYIEWIKKHMLVAYDSAIGKLEEEREI